MIASTEGLRKIEGAELAMLMEEIRARIESDTQVVGAPERTDVWDKGWRDALLRFRATHAERELIPAFIRPGRPVRYLQEFYDTTKAPYWELDRIREVQRGILATKLSGAKSIHEFGCGTGFNLVALAKLMPGIEMVGYDFSPAAVSLVNEVGKELRLNLKSQHFDMKYPFGALPEGSGVFTFGAIEQLSGKFHTFVEWLVAQKPMVVVHIEPTLELYDPANEVDSTAIEFHRKRGYTFGFLPHLEQHEAIEVLEVERLGFGSMMMEGYNLIMWRPR